MSKRHAIEWTDKTVNFFLTKRKGKAGWFCVKLSPGCAHCYAETLNLSPLALGTMRRGNHTPYTMPNANDLDPWFDEDALTKFYRSRRRYMIFCNDMTDTFLSVIKCRKCGKVWEDEFTPGLVTECPCRQRKKGELVRFWPTSWIQRTLSRYDELAERGHVIQVLTKRTKRLRAELRIWSHRNQRRLHTNVWVGFSAENQSTFDSRWREVRACRPYADGVFWVSYEPALARIDMAAALGEYCMQDAPSLGWAVVGGESGRNPRPFYLSFASTAIEQFREAGKPLFLKQLGGLPVIDTGENVGEWEDVRTWKPRPGLPRLFGPQLKHGKGGDVEEWPARFRVREFPRLGPLIEGRL